MTKYKINLTSHLDLLEIEHSEVGEPVDDEEAVVGLGHHWIVQQRQHRKRLHRGQRLNVGQLLILGESVLL